VAPDLAAAVMWFDALITNVDRTVRNTNILLADGQLWLIDHGAALYVHHRWDGWQARIQAPFPQIGDHVLLPFAGDLRAADARLRPRLTDAVLRGVVASIPEKWLGAEPAFADTAAHRAAYVTYLAERLRGPRAWLQAALDAQARGPLTLSPRQTHRVE
jgi:hypothetical protein